MKTSTILWIVAGAGALYFAKKATDATKAKIEKITADRDKAAGLTRLGDGSARPGSLIDASGNLIRPIGSALSSRMGVLAASTGGLGESWSGVPENDGGLYGGTMPERATASGLALMAINPYARTNATRMLPWWANKERKQVNFSTPADPYNLQAVTAKGDPTNAELRTSLNNGRPDLVNVDTHDGVDVVAQPQPYVEPGDRNYGDMTATDFLSDESNTYDEDPGALIGLRQN